MLHLASQQATQQQMEAQQQLQLEQLRQLQQLRQCAQQQELQQLQQQLQLQQLYSCLPLLAAQQPALLQPALYGFLPSAPMLNFSSPELGALAMQPLHATAPHPSHVYEPHGAPPAYLGAAPPAHVVMGVAAPPQTYGSHALDCLMRAQGAAAYDAAAVYAAERHAHGAYVSALGGLTYPGMQLQGYGSAHYAPPPLMGLSGDPLAQRQRRDEPLLRSSGDNGGYMPINLDYPGLRRVHESPPVYVVDGFLTADECDALIGVATPLLQRSKTHAAAGPEATRGRTSLTCHLAKAAQPCPLLLTRVSALTGKPFCHMELPQVARYTDGQRYVEHYDGVDPHCDAGRTFCASGGQRVGTVLVYLNDVPEGGGTFFRRLNLEVKPKRGSALLFFPGFANGELDLDALHAGLPPVGTKWVSQVWIRQSFREDGQPSSPVTEGEQALQGPLHEGVYKGHCLAGDDVHEALMTFEEARAWAATRPDVEGFTYRHASPRPEERVHVWFKSRMLVLCNEGWWSYSLGKAV